MHQNHVLTHWYSDPRFLDPQRNPRPLPLRGASPSLAELVGRVNPKIDTKAATDMLTRARALKRRGNRHTPTGRKVILDPSDIAATARSLSVLEGYIDTVNGNLNRRPEERAAASDPRARVGVGLFVYEQPQDQPNRQPKRRRLKQP